VSNHCFVLPFEKADGPTNMALDEALLECLVDDPKAAYLRTYGWLVPTLSLGYFQRHSQVEADPRWLAVPLVRRASGGGAIWHDHELTYAVVLSAQHPMARRSALLYRSVHAAIALALREQALDARPRYHIERRASEHTQRAAERPFLCFADRDPEDLVEGGSKVVGSAQRRKAGAILQHGSILLRAAAKTPEFPGISDLVPVSSDPLEWSEPVRNQIARALELVPEPYDPPAALRRRSRAIEDSIYRQRSWTYRR
jgi:lipoate-protein ligase A